jgi:hypothetical protein
MIQHSALLLLGWVTFIAWPYYVARPVWHWRSKGTQPPADTTNQSASAPRVGVVVATCNEVVGVEACLRSLIAQDHSNLAIVALADRSNDGTGLILDRLARESPRLHVIHVEQLPPGRRHIPPPAAAGQPRAAAVSESSGTGSAWVVTRTTSGMASRRRCSRPLERSWTWPMERPGANMQCMARYKRRPD